MRLLSTKEIKKASQIEKDRARAIDKHIAVKTKELNDYSESFEKKKKIILDDYIAFAEKITGQKTKLESKFASLEERKGLAFKSLSELLGVADKKFEEANKVEATFSVRERNLEEREKNTTEKEKKNVEFEKDLIARADKIALGADENKAYENRLQDRANKIAANFQERENVLAKKEDEVEKRLDELALGIDANNSTAKLLELREQRFEKHVRDEERLLQDKRDTLNRGFNELSTKQNGSK